ncbi:MAG: hypothetical protein GWN67_14765 [Phycisphaerae bacterium]|nr:hypothetical protein [Phycisphaerae bacterium]NIP52826.1 hypothetical protein [Phycisphaerae bacterium]NIS51847.1 hypothetical protein [Phycisphaerae bacterium]NIU09365.1 hypothetical protein [Phycisphaerae bacterium]NIU57598.1 hypothetical protein [Phycisphaerae bacterium]
MIGNVGNTEPQKHKAKSLIFIVVCFVLFAQVFLQEATACCVTDAEMWVGKTSSEASNKEHTSIAICRDSTVYFYAECTVDADSEGRPIKWTFDFGDGSSTTKYTYDSSSGPTSSGTYSETASHEYMSIDDSPYTAKVTVQREDAPGCGSKTDTCAVTVVEVESVDTDPAGQEVACTNEDVTFRVVTSTSGNYDLIYWWGGGTPETQEGGETFTTNWSSAGTKIVWAECDDCSESREIDIIDGFTVIPTLAVVCDNETKDFEAWICVNGTVENVTADSTFSTSNGSMKKPNGEESGPDNYRLHTDTPSSSVNSDWVRATYNGQTTDSDHDCDLTVRCCCTPQLSHISAQKYVSLLVGVEATIKTRYGDLCCEDCPLQPGGLQAAILGIIDDDYGAFGETGYLRTMSAGEIGQARFAEVKGPGNHQKLDWQGAPSEGSINTYRAEFDKSTGIWTFYYNETAWHTWPDFASYWDDKTCGRVYWSGEVHNLEDDMPGTSGNKCNFTGCQYKKDGGSYQPAGLTEADVADSTDKWGAEHVSGTAFNIWDKEPGEKTCP